MLKVLLLDLDGIVIRPRHKYFSEKFSEEYKIPLTEIVPFFKEKYILAAMGSLSIREVLPKYLKAWGWKKSLDEFLEYWFGSERTLDENVLKIVRNLRKEGVKVYLASDNEKERSKYVMETLKLKDEFDGGYFSYQIGYTKKELNFFKMIHKNLNVKPREIEYWDDDPENVKVAVRAGFKGKVYISFDDFKKDILL